jgi:hypothetical protein
VHVACGKRNTGRALTGGRDTVGMVARTAQSGSNGRILGRNGVATVRRGRQLESD